MLDTLITVTFNVFLFTLPLFALAETTAGFETDKQILLIVFSLLLLLFASCKMIFAKKISWIKTPLDLPLAALAGVYLLSGFTSQDKIGAFTSPAGATTFLFLIMLYFILTRVIASGKWAMGNLKSLFLSSSLLSLLILAKETGPSFLRTSLFSNLSFGGNTFSIAIFLLAIATLLGSMLFSSFRKKAGVMFALTALAAFILVFHLATDRKPIFLPFSFGWIIFMEMGKNIQTFLLGVGPGNFLAAYLAGKPISLNVTPYWNILFTSSSSFILTLATEVGFLGFFAFLILTRNVIRSLYTIPGIKGPKFRESLFLPLTILFISLYFVSSSLLTLILLVILLAFAMPKEELQYTIPGIKGVKFRESFLSFTTILFIIFLFYLAGRMYLANVFYRQALVFSKQADLSRAYALSEKAISLNPYMDSSYVLAGNLSLRLSTSSGNVEKTAYLQKSIDYARKAVELNRFSSENWANLGAAYQLFIGSAPEAQKATLDAYNQQLFLDPASPQPRLIVGKLLANLGAYDQAFSLFTQAVNLKPDWNSPRYQLALLYQQIQRPQAAAEELQRALALTPQNTPDYQTISQELDTLQKLLAPPATGSAQKSK